MSRYHSALLGGWAPLSKWGTPIYKPWKGHLQGEQPSFGDLLTMVTNHVLSEMILQVVASSIRQPRAPAERMGRWPHGQFLGAIAVGRPRMRYVQSSKKQELGFRFCRKRSRRIHETGTVYFRIHEWLIRIGKPTRYINIPYIDPTSFF